MVTLLSRSRVYTWRRSLNNVIVLRCVLSGKESVWRAEHNRGDWAGFRATQAGTRHRKGPAGEIS